ncbi:MAG: hypothetical protein IPJ61_02235 [Tessaracoccus sp.]|uniref:hypothetical protein n=1 Tax=Tessaracoccus sp. TaxID=1971211 RepID=UPI001EBD3369|nr:hypothetical protein [Tessaracoccus sp.]MBK7819908.1 hypothetical protein [Tessaracoccus sp.]
MTLVVGCYTVLGELDRLIGSVPAGGYAASLTAANTAPSERVYTLLKELHGSANGFVVAFVLVDCGLAITYGYLLHRALTEVRRRRVIPADAPLGLLTTPRPRLALIAAGADVVENLLLLGLVVGGLPLDVFAMGATAVKWLSLVGVLVPLLFAAFGTARGRKVGADLLRALGVHRFSLLAVLPVTLLALVPGPGILDQLPDIQRAWLDAADGRSGPLHGVIAILALGAVTVGVFLLGRLETDDLYRRRAMARRGEEQRPQALLWQWLFGPVLVGVLAMLSALSGGSIRWGVAAIFAGIPLTLMASSWWLRRRGGLVQPRPREPKAPVRLVWAVGDILALAGVVAASLGLLRSFTVLAAVPEAGANPAVVWPAILLGPGAAVSLWWVGIPALTFLCGRWPSVRALVRPGAGWGMRNLSGDSDHSARLRAIRGGAWAGIVGSTVLLVLIGAGPRQAADIFGVLGVVMISLGLLMLLVGTTVAVHVTYAPPELFWTKALRLREVPVVGLLLVVLLAATMQASSHEVHGARALPEPATVGDTPQTVVGQWRQRIDDTGCRVNAGSARNPTWVRPMVFVAAEGGGIRAAYWTAAVLSQLGSTCAVDAVVLASGVSGGSVGLAVLRVTAAGDAADAVWGIGDAAALGQAVDGMLVRDLAYSVTGVPGVIGGEWLDRAGLMETAWEARTPGLAANFYTPATGALKAPLVLNVTDANTGCRVLATHLVLDRPRLERCRENAAPLANSRDLRDYLADAARPANDDDRCLDGVRLSTAAMFSARFPYVTPSGVVGPCRQAAATQLIDGGYAEGSGLGSLVDLAPRLLAVAPNDDVPVLPIVVYLDNGRGSDLAPPPPGTLPELLVPPLGLQNSRGSQQSPTAWLQRAKELSVGRTTRPPRVFVVAQDSVPGVQAPLGWVLSSASRSDMDRSIRIAVERAAQHGPDLGDEELQQAEQEQRQGYPGLAELIRLFTTSE